MYSEITTEAGLAGYGPKNSRQRLGGLAAADVNGDGHVDFVQTFSNHGLEMFINNGEGVFEEQSESLELDIGEYYYWQPFFHDFNDDGYIDMYCNVDFDENKFFVNSPNAVFDEQSRISNSNHNFNEMGITLGDFDNDGDFDIYASNAEKYLGEDLYSILLQRNEHNVSDIYFDEIAREDGALLSLTSTMTVSSIWQLPMAGIHEIQTNPNCGCSNPIGHFLMNPTIWVLMICLVEPL
jgi:hypothetical protein